MVTTVVLFNRDLRVNDHEGLCRAADEGRVIPLFVVDDALRGVLAHAPNRARFLVESLDDLNASLTRLGAPLVTRCGDPAEIAASFGADAVIASADYTPVARRREDALNPTLAGGIPMVAPGVATPTGGDRYKVFTPYWNRWQQVPKGRVLAPPKLQGVDGLASDDIGWLRAIEPTATDLAPGGETAGRDAIAALSMRLWGYADKGHDDKGHDDLAGDSTSRLSPYLHFGCVSARDVSEQVATLGADGDALVRQLCWRDFFLQYEALEPRWPVPAKRPPQLDAWEQGRTGYPLVDAGMRQLVKEGWMHNRARMVTASFLTKDLQIDWPFGAAFFMRHLVDADVAQNNGNWKWVAGVGTDTRPDRAFNPLRQQQRFDKRAEYIRRYVPEYDTPDYPDPIIPESELAAARARR